VEPSQPRWWTKERWVGVGVFAGFTLLNMLLNCAGVLIAVYTVPPAPPPPGQVLDVWLWALAFPVMLAQLLGVKFRPSEALILWLLNGLFYGGMGWFAWRMWRLKRRRTT